MFRIFLAQRGPRPRPGRLALLQRGWPRRRRGAARAADALDRLVAATQLRYRWSATWPAASRSAGSTSRWGAGRAPRARRRPGGGGGAGRHPDGRSRRADRGPGRHPRADRPVPGRRIGPGPAASRCSRCCPAGTTASRTFAFARATSRAARSWRATTPGRRRPAWSTTVADIDQLRRASRRASSAAGRARRRAVGGRPVRVVDRISGGWRGAPARRGTDGGAAAAVSTGSTHRARGRGGRPARRTSPSARRGQTGEVDEDDLVRGVHPMVGRRLNLWRLRNFTSPG